MADSGKLASFTFNSVTFDETDCLQGWNLNDAINEIVYQCDSMDKGVAGTRTVTFSGSMALSATDTAKLAALTPGATAADFEAHPSGDTATYIEVSSTDSLCVSANLSTAANSVHTVDFSIRLNDVTIGAAT
jgi:hypothetical protein